ncbi:MAG: hypothetical protein WDA20_03980 [Desulfuromonadales bacterium]
MAGVPVQRRRDRPWTGGLPAIDGRRAGIDDRAERAVAAKKKTMGKRQMRA